MKEKVIQLGISRGYIPNNRNIGELFEAFKVQHLRLIKEVGEAADEIRANNQPAFTMEWGDVQVLKINCQYIMMEMIKSDLNHPLSIKCRTIFLGTNFFNIISLAGIYFNTDYSEKRNEEYCLSLAYEKIKDRRGVLIGKDWFKESDPEYEEGIKLKAVEAYELNKDEI